MVDKLVERLEEKAAFLNADCDCGRCQQCVDGLLLCEAAKALRLATPANGEQVERAAIDQNDTMRQELAHIGNLVTDLARKMKVDQANDDGSWPNLAGRVQRLIDATPTEDARERVKVLEKARPFSEWHEDHGDVLWWKLPIMESPYCGSPLDLGRGMKVTVQIGFEEHEMPITNTGGWPFTEEDEPNLWWTPLPSPTFFRAALGNKETDRHG